MTEAALNDAYFTKQVRSVQMGRLCHAPSVFVARKGLFCRKNTIKQKYADEIKKLN